MELVRSFTYDSKIENITFAVVREYLHGKGYHKTLSCLDNEAADAKATVNSRTQLARLLGLEKLLKKNKHDPNPLKTMLEIVIKHVVGHKSNRQTKVPIKSTSLENEVTCLPSVSFGEEELLKDSWDTVKQLSSLLNNNQSILSATLNEQTSEDKGSSGNCDNELEYTHCAPPIFSDFSSQLKSAVKFTKRLTSNNSKKKEFCDENQQSVMDVLSDFAPSNPYKSTVTDTEISISRKTCAGHNSALLSSDFCFEEKPVILDKIIDVTSVKDLASSRAGHQSNATSMSESSTTLKTAKDKALMKPSSRRSLVDHVRNSGLQIARNQPTSGRKGNFFSGSTHHPVTTAIINEGGSEAIIHKSFQAGPMEYATKKISDIAPSSQDSNGFLVNCDPDNASVLKEADYVKNEKMGNWLGGESPTSRLKTQHKTMKTLSVDKCMEIELGDIDEIDERNSGLIVSPDPSHVWLTIPHGVLFDCDSAVRLKTLLLGNYKMNFSEEWKIQNFCLSKNPKVSYGIVQKKGGPCGVLACVQAYLVKEMIFKKARKISPKGEYSSEECGKCLALALANILWKGGDKQSAVVAMPSSCEVLVDVLPGLCDGFIEKMSIVQFSDFAALQSFLNRHISWYTSENKYVCIAFLYSAILSRGIDKVKNDMDDPKACLIAKNGYCSQEIVNLLLTGHATSNVFDNIVTLDDGKESHSILKGVSKRSEIGFLALFEHYNSCQVGTFLKSPLYPIWVVCSESHFSVLFAKDLSVNEVDSNNVNELFKFELFYYDGLLQQEDEIKLTIKWSNNVISSVKDLIPPLEHCIRTKWKCATVDWNGTDPLL